MFAEMSINIILIISVLSLFVQTEKFINEKDRLVTIASAVQAAYYSSQSPMS